MTDNTPDPPDGLERHEFNRSMDEPRCVECGETWPCDATVRRTKDGLPHRMAEPTSGDVALPVCPRCGRFASHDHDVSDDDPLRAAGHAPMPPAGGDLLITYLTSEVIALGNRRYDEGWNAALRDREAPDEREPRCEMCGSTTGCACVRRRLRDREA